MTTSPASSLTSKLIWCSALLLVTSPWWLRQLDAQPPVDPFGGGAPAAPAPKAETKKGSESADIPKAESEVILQLRDANPTTADQLIQAAGAVLNFGRPDECKRYLAKFIAGKFPEDDLAGLPGKYGTAFFLEIAANAKVQPEGKQVSDQVILAAKKLAENPARLAGLVRTLSDPNYEAASAALTRLEQAGPALVGPMLEALVDPKRSAEHPRLYSALLDLRDTTESPLIGVLAGAPEPQQIVAANALGDMESRHAVRHLLAPALAANAPPDLRVAARRALTKIMGGVPQLHESERYLQTQIEQISTGQHPFQVNADNNTLVWQWDAAKLGPAARVLALEDAIRQLNARLANDLYRLNPASKDYERLRVLHHLEFAKSLRGVGRPLSTAAMTSAKQAGVEVLTDVLSQAMKERLHAAAIAAIEVLSEIGTADLLASDGPGVLSTALTHADRRIRQQAALAIVKFNPTKSFAGASLVPEILGDAVRTAGLERVLIVDSRVEYGQTIAGLLADQGYYGEVAVGSRDAFRLAAAGPDYQMVLISDVLDLPPIEMVQLLRRDRRTAFLPIAVMVGADIVDDLPKVLHDTNYRQPVGRIREDKLDSLTVQFATDRRTTVVPRPHSSESAAFLAQQVKLLGGREMTSTEERLIAGRAALDAIQKLVSDKETFNRYGMLRQEGALIVALNSPPLAAQAAQVLGTLATPKAQTALVDVCSQPARPIEVRQAALEALKAAVKSRGIMLTQQQILNQYERYNDREAMDRPTQEVLGAVLDTLESRRPAPALKPLIP